jgi:hypothetical protein
VDEGARVRPGHDKARQRHQQSFSRAFRARHAHAGQLALVRVYSGEDGGAQEELGGETDPGVAQVPVQRAHLDLRDRFISGPLPTTLSPLLFQHGARCVDTFESERTFESSCRCLWVGIWYVF